MKLIRFMLAALLALPLYAQNPDAGKSPANLAGTLYASNFGYWTVPMGNNGPFSWSNRSACTVQSGAVSFYAFTVGTPVLLVDPNPTLSEVITPTAVTIGNSGCQVTMTALAHPHTSFYLTTSTAGLQEAIDYANGLPYMVYVTPDFTRLRGVTGTITSAKGSTAVSILDVRNSCPIAYTWGGSSYAGTDLCTGGGGTQTVVQLNGTPISPLSPANFVDTASVFWTFVGGQIQARSTGGGVCGTGFIPCLNTPNTWLTGVQTFLSSGINNIPVVVRGAGGGFATPAFVQASSVGVPGPFFGCAVTLPNVSAGDAIIVIASPPHGTPVAFDSLGNSYALVGNDSTPGTQNPYIFIAANVLPGTDTVTVNNTGEVSACMALEYSGVALTDPVDASAIVGGTSSGTSFAVGPISTTLPNDIVVSLLEAGFATTPPATGYTLNYDGKVNSPPTDMVAASKFESSPASVSATWTGPGPVSGWTAVLIALKAAGSTLQSSDLTQWQDYTTAVLSRINSNGQYTPPSTDGCPTNTPLGGSIAYDSTATTLCYYNGASWQHFGSAGVSSINGTPGAFTFSFSSGAGSCSGSTCTFTGSGSGGGSVTNFVASAGSWPSWLVPSVATSTTTPTLTVTAGPIPNAALANDSVTIGSTNVVLGTTAGTISGLTLVAPALGTIASGVGTALTALNGSNISSGTVAAARLPVFGSAAAGIVPLSGGGTTNFLRADGTWAAPPGGGGGCTSSGAQGVFQAAGSTSGTCQATAFTDNGSIVASTEPIAITGPDNGSVDYTATGTTLGSVPANTVRLAAPNAVTAYEMDLPAARPTGSSQFLTCTPASPTICSFQTVSAAGTSTLVASEESVSFSATPTFSIAFRESTINLTAAITSFTLSAGAAGQEKTLTFCQDATGGRNVTPPANVHGFMNLSGGGETASTCSSQHFTYNSIHTAWIADSPGVLNE